MDTKRWRAMEGEAIINSMPDEILGHILSFAYTETALKTSVLSKRWRYVWSQSPSLNISMSCLSRRVINQILSSYKAPRIKSFTLSTILYKTNPQKIDTCIDLAISRSVEKLSLTMITFHSDKIYSLPGSLFLCSSVKELTLCLDSLYQFPTCPVSWKSLKTLYLSSCKLGDGVMDNIVSGCPVLEKLTLHLCGLVDERLDLRKLLSLRSLWITKKYGESGPMEIVAPQIRYLNLLNHKLPTTLVDVSSLSGAHLDIMNAVLNTSEARLFHTTAIDLVSKCHNVRRLTVGATTLQILSLAEFSDVPFPTLKVQTLIVSTELARSAIHGIVKLLQNSPELKKLTLRTMFSGKVMIMDVKSYLDSQGLDPDQCWGSEYEVFPTTREIYQILGCNDATSKLLVSFMELVLRNTKSLETMVLCLDVTYFQDAQWIEKLLHTVATLSHNNNVSIVLKRSN
ncbi:unnamed protein product [Cochlearia groenlandica]